MKMQVTLSEDEIKNIIAAHLRREGMTPIGEVELDINHGSRLVSHGMMERRENYCDFNGAKVEVETRKVDTFVPGEQ